MRDGCIPLVVLLVISGRAGTSAGHAPENQPALLKITTKRSDDTVEVRRDKDKTLLIMKSPVGISQAIIQRASAQWPAAVVVRLHLKGLERFRASNGTVAVEAAVAMAEGELRVRRWKGNEIAIRDETSPLWTAIRVIGADGKPAQEIPLADGYFDVTLPKALFEGNPKSITLTWIDFYRN